MKGKFIMIIMAVVLVVALIAFAVPVASPDVSGAASAGLVASTADLAIMDGEATLFIDSNVTPAPAATAAGMPIWLVTSAILLSIAVVCRRRLKLSNIIGVFSRRNDRINEGTVTGGGSNKFILPVAA